MTELTTMRPAMATNVDATRIAQRAALIVAMLGSAVVSLDAQITDVALRAIHQHLGGGLSGLQWIVTGYTLMFSALLLLGGSIADRIGRKHAYRSGMALFVLASLLCGLAPNLPVLIGARLVQVDWRLIFFINVRVGTAALVALVKAADSPRRPGRTARAGSGVYAATKWGINGWSESLRQELLPGVRVTLIEPGVVATELPNHITHADTKQAVGQLYDQAEVTAEDVAEIIDFVLARPRRLVINEVLLRPAGQQ